MSIPSGGLVDAKNLPAQNLGTQKSSNEKIQSSNPIVETFRFIIEFFKSLLGYGDFESLSDRVAVSQKQPAPAATKQDPVKSLEETEQPVSEIEQPVENDLFNKKLQVDELLKKAQLSQEDFVLGKRLLNEMRLNKKLKYRYDNLVKALQPLAAQARAEEEQKRNKEIDRKLIPMNPQSS